MKLKILNHVAAGDKTGRAPPVGLFCKAYLLPIPYFKFLRLLAVLLGTQTRFLELVRPPYSPLAKPYASYCDWSCIGCKLLFGLLAMNMAAFESILW